MATERWNDEMLDKLASSVSELRAEMKESIGALRDEMKESVGALRDEVSELREGLKETKDSIDGLRLTSQALLQVAAQHQKKMDQFEEEAADRKREIEVMERKVEAMEREQAENSKRFDVLLGEIRYLIRGKE